MFTVILYLTDDANSTAFPKFPSSEFAVPQYPSPNSNEAINTMAMCCTVEAGRLEKEQYDFWRTRVGDMYTPQRTAVL